jgi:hypothetical protein
MSWLMNLRYPSPFTGTGYWLASGIDLHAVEQSHMCLRREALQEVLVAEFH